MKTALLMRAGFGVKGLMFWCWRPRLSDIEGNDFGMCKPNGKPLARTCELGEFAERMKELSSVYNALERRSDVAVYMSYQINHLMKGDRMNENYLSGITGANYMLTDLHINSDFINDKEILKGSLNRYKVLIMPCTYIITEECAAKIAEFVQNGGHVIADYILAEKRPGGLCYTELPGAGLNSVFGIEREDVLYIAHPTMERPNTFGIATGTIVEQVNLTDAESIVGEYQPGFPLMTRNRFGNGTATYIATQFFSKYLREPTCSLRQHLFELLADAGVTPYAELCAEDGKNHSALVTSAMYDRNGRLGMITVSNTDYEEITDIMVIPDGEYAFVEDHECISFVSKNGRKAVRFTLKSLESFSVFRL